MKLKIEKRAWQKITAYASHCPYEIGGLGKVTCDGADFFVSDAEIFEQKVTPTHVDMTAETLAKFQVSKIKAGESLKDYKLWWHSHAAMATFLSKTDTDTIDESGAEFPWLVSLVVNHKHEHTARLDIFVPVHVHCPLDIEIMEDVDPSIEAACKDDIARMVTFPAPRTYTPYLPYYQTPGFKDKGFIPVKGRLAELKDELAKKEKHLAKVQKMPKGKRTSKAIDALEQDIADISLEIDARESMAEQLGLESPLNREYLLD